MRVVQINSFSNGSTGKIMMSIHKELIKHGHDSYVVWGRGRKSDNDHEIYLNDKLGIYFHALYSRITGKTGFASRRSTKKLIKLLEEIKPDIVHIHNIHGYYINIELLFGYLKTHNIRVIWTLHDCWAFTGQCAFFSYINCNKWKKHCEKCPMLNEYPKSFIDNSKWNYDRKKELFTGVQHLSIVTPSKWLANLVKQSYLKEYDINAIYNGIDTNVFKHTDGNYIKRLNIENKKIILGVANVWSNRKGLDDFLRLSKVIDDNYVIVLVGLNDQQIKSLPSNVIGIKRTDSQSELAELYSASDVYFNPSKEETFGLTTVEALSCGTPALIYNCCAMPEIVGEIGKIIDSDDENIVYKNIQEIISSNIQPKDNMEYTIDKMTNCYIQKYCEELKIENN